MPNVYDILKKQVITFLVFFSRILQMEQAREAEIEERKLIREDFQRKIVEMEKKVLAVSRDKDSLKTLLHEAEVEIARR
jgi:hypothetical protein